MNDIRLRNACQRDVQYIHELFDKYDFKIDPKHLERLIVTEEGNGNITGVLYLNSVLECSFITDERLSRRSRCNSLNLLVAQGKREVKAIGYDLVHAFSNEKLESILKKHFGFTTGKGTNLILFVE